MDLRQLGKDILTMNGTALKLRADKGLAVLRRMLLTDKSFDPKKAAIIINNRNRLSHLRLLVDWLQKNGYQNIHILDNDSTYPPLLEYYKLTSCSVHYLGENVGHLALWKTGLYRKFERSYYVYTDPDVVPSDECPADVIAFLYQQLRRFPFAEKAGLGLRIDDLPDHYANKDQVIDWEKKYWEKQISPGIYDAEVDTTFALYRPFTNGAKWVQRAVRTGPPYIARHLPWYENSSAPDPEDVYYRANVKQGASHWIKK
jgi:hypothetical protein